MSDKDAELDSWRTLAHDLRSQLGTCLAVLEDLVAGYQLTPEEIRDGRDAAKKMAELLRIRGAD